MNDVDTHNTEIADLRPGHIWEELNMYLHWSDKALIRAIFNYGWTNKQDEGSQVGKGAQWFVQTVWTIKRMFSVC